LACLENKKSILEGNNKIWMKRSASTQKLMKETGFEFAKPDAGIYIYLTHPKMRGSDAGQFVEKCLENGVVIAPGDEFGNTDFVRFCINQPEDVLAEAIEKMSSALR
jgi:aspartate/methionine/tyrosine aminotransferase